MDMEDVQNLRHDIRRLRELADGKGECFSEWRDPGSIANRLEYFADRLEREMFTAASQGALGTEAFDVAPPQLGRDFQVICDGRGGLSIHLEQGFSATIRRDKG